MQTYTKTRPVSIRVNQPLSRIQARIAEATVLDAQNQDRAYFTDNDAEFFVRPARMFELRGIWIRCGCRTVPNGWPLWPGAVVVSRRRGATIERFFRPDISPGFVGDGRKIIINGLSPSDWWLLCTLEREQQTEIIFGDVIRLGGVS